MIYVVIAEVIVRLYILHKASLKMDKKEYLKFYSYFIDVFTSRNFLAICLFYTYMSFGIILIKVVFDILMHTHLTALWVLNAIYLNVLIFL